MRSTSTSLFFFTTPSPTEIYTLSLHDALPISIQSRDDLVRQLSKGCRPKADWRIGTEHEKFVYDLKTHKPVSYEGKPGIRQLLEGMQRFGWQPVREGEHIIGLSQNGASLSLEPGGQFELSGAPLRTVHETCNEVDVH